jgi:nucleotide-binding universal stress UspA family protein
MVSCLVVNDALKVRLIKWWVPALGPGMVLSSVSERATGSVQVMKILVPIDGSQHSEAAVTEVAGRTWPSGTEIRILTVIHSSVPLMPDPAFVLAATHIEQLHDQRAQAGPLLQVATDRVHKSLPEVSVTTKMLEGLPHEVIVKAATDWGADLIVLGSHGRSPRRQGLLGSVAGSVAADAPCAVEIVRLGRRAVHSAPARDDHG